MPKGQKISKRYGHSAVVYNDSMYVFGGYDDFGLTCNDLWEFNFGMACILPLTNCLKKKLPNRGEREGRRESGKERQRQRESGRDRG